MERSVFSMKRHRIVILFATMACSVAGQRLALKENLPFAAPNLGMEVAVGPNLTLDVWGAYNPFEESSTRKWKLWTIQPELRYWFCKDFTGSFIGLHAGAGQYNMGGIGRTFDLGGFGSLDLDGLKDYRVQGSFWDAGFSYGRHWILSPRWGVEATVGFGYGAYRYERYCCLECGERTGSGTGNYLGPTRLGVSLVYLLR